MNSSVDADGWQSQKLNHKSLAAQAAGKYDSEYTLTNFATQSYMEYEERLIETYAFQSNSELPALDLGSGTGRTSFLASKFFKQVIGVDFSEEMVRQSKTQQKIQGIRNVRFQQHDVEDGLVFCADASSSFINTAFGMGSFVQNLDMLLDEISRVLVPGGISILSFYNSRPLFERLDLPWKPALAARFTTDDGLKVDFAGQQFSIAAKAYSVEEINQKTQSRFQVLQLTTFPSLSAIMPQEFFQSDAAQQLCRAVDELLSFDLKISAGPYIVAICQKR
jgi:ubiquinone/menaquinone biosynthesis C-methylase UbiE